MKQNKRKPTGVRIYNILFRSAAHRVKSQTSTTRYTYIHVVVRFVLTRRHRCHTECTTVVGTYNILLHILLLQCN